jgi:hypothetical protein
MTTKLRPFQNEYTDVRANTTLHICHVIDSDSHYPWDSDFPIVTHRSSKYITKEVHTLISGNFQ